MVAERHSSDEREGEREAVIHGNSVFGRLRVCERGVEAEREREKEPEKQPYKVTRRLGS